VILIVPIVPSSSPHCVCFIGAETTFILIVIIAIIVVMTLKKSKAQRIKKLLINLCKNITTTNAL
jgi:hypothetical protein